MNLIYSFNEITEISREFEQSTLASDRVRNDFFPKYLLMSVVSIFEKRIKLALEAFIARPQKPIRRNYKRIHRLVKMKKRSNMTTADIAYGYLHKDRPIAKSFYKLFGSKTFKPLVEGHFAAMRLAETNNVAGQLFTASGQEKIALEDHARLLRGTDYVASATDFMDLKGSRNTLAHDFVADLSRTFDEIMALYGSATLFTHAIIAAINDLTKHP